MPVDVVHLLAVALWLGGLCALLVALFRAPADTPIEGSAVRRFSQVAFGSVLALIATGIYQSWRQLGSWSAFTGTSYGQLLLVKIGLVIVLVGIAYISRRWTAQLPETAATVAAERTEDLAADAEKEPVAAGAAGGGDAKRTAQLARQRAAVDTARLKRLRNADPLRSGLRRSVLAEAGIAVVLLAVTTALTSTEPGRTEEEAKAATSASASSSSSDSSSDATGALTLDMPFDTGGQDGKGVVRVDISPAQVGGNVMHVYVDRPNGRAFDVPELKVAFTLTAKKIGPLPVTPDHLATGHWTANGLQIPMAGNWNIAVTVRTSDIDQVTVDKNAQIG